VAYSTISVLFERVARPIPPFKGVSELPFGWLRELRPDRLWGR